MTRTTEHQPTIRVLGLGAEDWDAEPIPQETAEERARRERRRHWERYGTVRVQIGDVVYEVGAVIGVPEYLRATAEAAGGDPYHPAYLTAWYLDPTDWSCAPASHGPDGVPSDLSAAVLTAIHEASARLWQEYQEQRRAEAEAEAEA